MVTTDVIEVVSM